MGVIDRAKEKATEKKKTSKLIIDPAAQENAAIKSISSTERPYAPDGEKIIEEVKSHGIPVTADEVKTSPFNVQNPSEPQVVKPMEEAIKDVKATLFDITQLFSTSGRTLDTLNTAYNRVTKQVHNLSSYSYEEGGFWREMLFKQQGLLLEEGKKLLTKSYNNVK